MAIRVVPCFELLGSYTCAAAETSGAGGGGIECEGYMVAGVSKGIYL